MKAPASIFARTLRWLSRGAALATALALLTSLCGAPALAGDLMLEDAEIGPSGMTGVGWSFTGLTLVSLGFSVYYYNQSQDELDKADKNYKQYKAADTTADALFYRDKVQKHRSSARTAETRANLGIALTLVFALTAFYSFSPDSAPDISITATLNGPMLEWRF